MSRYEHYEGKFPYSSDFEVNLAVGGTCIIGKHSYGIEMIRIETFNSNSRFSIGRFCSVATCNFLMGGNHPYHYIAQGLFLPKFFPAAIQLEEDHYEEWLENSTKGNITVGNDVWIGNFATIMSGVTIGDGAVIAANAHVFKDVPPYTIVGGNPAKLIKLRHPQPIIDLLLELKWWEFEDYVINEILPVLKSEPTEKMLKKLIQQTKTATRTQVNVL